MDKTDICPEGDDMFDEAFPILSTPDLERALGFYRDLLDGTVAYRFPPDGEPVYVSLDIGRSQLGLGANPDTPPGALPQRFAMWVYADDCDAAVSGCAPPGSRSSRSRRISPGVSGSPPSPTRTATRC